MNFEAKRQGPGSGGINWRKIIPVAIVLLVAGYIYGRPHLENLLGVQLPALGERDPGGQNADGQNDDNDFNYDANLPGGGSSGSIGAAGDRNDPLAPKTFDLAAVQASGFAIEKTGRDTYTTPAGLVYTMGPRREHRIDHVLRHSADQPERDGPHGVFECDSTADILAMIDEAYEKIKADSRDVRIVDANNDYGDRTAYTIHMQRRIGYKGGSSGGRSNHPPLKILKLILQSDNKVISAFPYR